MNDQAQSQDEGSSQTRGRGQGLGGGRGGGRGRGRGRGFSTTPEPLQSHQAFQEIQPVPGYPSIQPRPPLTHQRPGSSGWSPESRYLHPAIPHSYELTYNGQSQNGTPGSEANPEVQQMGREEEVRNWDRKYSSVANPSTSYVSPYAAPNARRLSSTSVTSQSSRPRTPTNQSELQWFQKLASPERRRASISQGSPSSPGHSRSPTRPNSAVEVNPPRRDSTSSSRTAEPTVSEQNTTTPGSKKFSRRHRKRGPYNKENVVRRDSE